MFNEHFIDLDELLLKCRNNNAKKYIHEAILCYKIGAFRVSIISTWIALVYDFVDKLRELSNEDDKNAKEKLETFDKARRNANLAEALKFERNILNWSFDEFQFISLIQKEDLERLRTDRHRCAHPSMMTEDETYQPSAEQARLHIRNAVLYFLQYPPTQGKVALEKLRNDIISEIFPIDSDQALIRLKNSPLQRPRPALVKNFVKVMLKEFLLLEAGENEGNQKRIACAVNAVRKLHRLDIENYWSVELNHVVEKVEHKDFAIIVRFLALVEDTWEYLNEGMKITIENYVQKISFSETRTIAYATQVTQLKPYALEFLSHANKEDLALIIKEFPDISYFDYAIQQYSKSRTVAEFEYVSRELILPLTSFLDVEYATKILQAFQSNAISYSSPNHKLILEAIIKAKNIPEKAINELFSDFGIDDMGDLSITLDEEDIF